MSHEDPTTHRAEEVLSKEELCREVQEVINQLDMKTLEDVFAEKLEKAGVKETRGKVWGKDRIALVTPDNPGEYNLAGAELFLKKLLLNPEGIILEMKKRDIKDSLREVILSIIVHEETHVVANSKFYPEHTGPEGYARSLADNMYLIFAQSGNTRYEQRGPVKRVLFEAYNEAVNDMIAEEVAWEYYRRLGVGKTQKFIHGYKLEREMLKAFIEKLARAADIPEHMIWEAIQGHNLRGDDLRTKELAELFTEYFSESFLKILGELRGFKTREELEDFMQKHLLEPSIVPESIDLGFKRWGALRKAEGRRRPNVRHENTSTRED